MSKFNEIYDGFMNEAKEIAKINPDMVKEEFASIFRDLASDTAKIQSAIDLLQSMSNRYISAVNSLPEKIERFALEHPEVLLKFKPDLIEMNSLNKKKFEALLTEAQTILRKFDKDVLTKLEGRLGGDKDVMLKGMKKHEPENPPKENEEQESK